MRQSGPSLYISLAAGLEQQHARGDRNIQAFHPTGHRDGNQVVTQFPCQAAQPLPLATQHQRQRSRQVGVVQELLGRVTGPADPDPGLPQQAQGARQIGYAADRD